tara:strand:+ start:156 stop:455 length:300 start_codon:yes stop_codon:yes gene_type:complete
MLMSKDIKRKSDGNSQATLKQSYGRNNTMTKFPRAHQFNKLDTRQQHEFAKEMAKLWGGIIKEIEAQAVDNGSAYYREQEFSYKAKAAYTQVRKMFTWK